MTIDGNTDRILLIMNFFLSLIVHVLLVSLLKQKSFEHHTNQLNSDRRVAHTMINVDGD